MSEPEPFFSIITPVYNGAAFLPDLIASVQAQTFSDYEHIIIDDGSTDDGATIGVLEAVDDSRIHWWTRANRGQYATQNEGIQAARGRWIVVIAADDILAAPDVLAGEGHHRRRGQALRRNGDDYPAELHAQG